jgi:DNA-binding IclR family transcriptional regulator
MPQVQTTVALRERSPHGGCAILSRYALVLDTVAQASSGLPLTEIGQRTALPQATVYRLVHALVHVGFLTHGERRKHYVLGPRLLRLLCAGVPHRTIRQLAQPILDRLAAEFGETAFIAKLEGDKVETVAVAPPKGERQAFVHPGRSMPFHAAASAKAILAFADDRLVGDILAKTHPRFTARTKTSEQEIAAELAKVRQQGFAICDRELDPGVLSYACPIRVGGAGVVYSLGLVGLADRLGGSPSAEIVSSLKTAAETLSNVIRDDAGSSSVWASAPPGGNGVGRLAAEL